MNKSFTALVIDDEPLARKGLLVRLANFTQIDIIGECANGRDALAAIAEKKPDIIFLDIQMPGINGFELVNQLLLSNANLPVVIFVTAFDQYAIKAFEVHALDYLLKPVDEERLSITINKILEHFSSKEDAEHKDKLLKLMSDVTGSDSQQILLGLNDKSAKNLVNYSDILAIKDGSEITRVPVADIIWVDAAGDYMCVHTEHETHILRKTMKELEQLLDPKIFIRTHRSIIVNLNYVLKFSSQVNGEYFLTLTNQKEIKVSRSYKDKVKQCITH